MLTGRTSFPRLCLVLILGLWSSGCAESEMTILDEELGRYRLQAEEYRRESLEDRYFEESMRCEDLTIEILELEGTVDDKTRELADLQARLAELESQLAAAREQLAAAEKAQAASAKPPAGEAPREPARAPVQPPEQKPAPQ